MLFECPSHFIPRTCVAYQSRAKSSDVGQRAPHGRPDSLSSKGRTCGASPLYPEVVKLLACGFAAAASLLGVLAADEIDPSDLTLDQLLEAKVTTVTTATLHEQSVALAPTSASVITSDDIKKLGYRTLADILAGTRGFYVSYDRNYSYLGERGFGRPGDYNSRVLILVDGHRINDNVTGGALIGNEFLLDVDLIDRVEVIRGPGSVIYGNNAFFGVVNVKTRRGKDISGVETSFTAGSYDSYQGRVTVGYELDNGVDFLLSGTLLNRTGHEHLYYTEYRSPTNPSGVTRGADGEESRSTFGRVSWQGMTFEGGWGERTKHVPTGSFDTVFGDDRNQTVDGTYYLSWNLEHTFENEFTLSALASYNTYYYKGTYIYPTGSPDAGNSTYSSIDHISGRWWTEDVHGRKTFWDQFTLTAGAEARQNVAQNQNTYQDHPYRVTLDSHQDSFVWAPYIQGEWAVRTNLLLSAGVRYDQGDFRGQAVSPRITVVYQPIPETTVKFLYGRAFRGPSAYERFYSDGGLTQKGNTDLNEEKVDTYEIVLEQEITRHFTGALIGYFYLADDLINLTTDPTDGLLVYQNISEVRGRGIEAEIRGHFDHGLRGRLSYSIQKAVDELALSELENSPRHLIQGNLQIPFYNELLFGGAEVRYMANRTRGSQNQAPSYWIANFTIYSRNILRGIELSLSINNIFDHRYFDPSPVELLQPVLEQDGRTWQVKLTGHF